MARVRRPHRCRALVPTLRAHPSHDRRNAANRPRPTRPLPFADLCQPEDEAIVGVRARAPVVDTAEARQDRRPLVPDLWPETCYSGASGSK